MHWRDTAFVSPAPCRHHAATLDTREGRQLSPPLRTGAVVIMENRTPCSASWLRIPVVKSVYAALRNQIECTDLSVETDALCGAGAATADASEPATPGHVAMNWARRLKRGFGIEIEDCARCGGKLAILASIEEPEVIAKILAHLDKVGADQSPELVPVQARAPPTQVRLL